MKAQARRALLTNVPAKRALLARTKRTWWSTAAGPAFLGRICDQPDAANSATQLVRPLCTSALSQLLLINCQASHTI